MVNDKKKTFIDTLIEKEIRRKRASYRKKQIQKKESTHGAYSFIVRGAVPKERKYLLDWVLEERSRWVEDLGGEEQLNYIEISLLDEACRMLLYCMMINDYLIKDKDKNIVYTDPNTGEVKMHSALSRNYLSYSKIYVNILKELNKIAKSKGVGTTKINPAAIIQNIYKESTIEDNVDEDNIEEDTEPAELE